MKTINLLGVTNSIILNKKQNYIAACYSDIPAVSFHDYQNGALLHTIKTQYCSSESNVMAANDNVLAILTDAKQVRLFDTKNFTDTGKAINVKNCNGVNSLLIHNNKLYVVTSNLATNDSPDLFVYDINTGVIESIRSGYSLKKGFIFNNNLILVGSLARTTFIMAAPTHNDGNSIIPSVIATAPSLPDESISSIVVYEACDESPNIKISVEHMIFGKRSLFTKNCSNTITISKDLTVDIAPTTTNKTIAGFLSKNTFVNISFCPDRNKTVYTYEAARSGTDVKILNAVVNSATALNEDFFAYGSNRSVVLVEHKND